MSSKLPDQLVVASLPLRVGRFPEGFGDDDCGQFEEQSSTIHLSKDLAPATERLTLLHELIHALVFIGGLRSAIKSEERVCDTLSLLLHDLLRNNPELVRYLVAKD